MITFSKQRAKNIQLHNGLVDEIEGAPFLFTVLNARFVPRCICRKGFIICSEGLFIAILIHVFQKTGYSENK